MANATCKPKIRERYVDDTFTVLDRDHVMFQHVKYAKLNAYADGHQIYSSNLDPLALKECICQEVNVANQWYKNNGMIVNVKEHQVLILGKT